MVRRRLEGWEYRLITGPIHVCLDQNDGREGGVGGSSPGKSPISVNIKLQGSCNSVASASHPYITPHLITLISVDGVRLDYYCLLACLWPCDLLTAT